MHLLNRRVLVVVGGWLAAALVATLAGVGGIRLIGESLTGTPGGVLSEDDVERALAAGPPPASTAPRPTGSAPSPAGRTTFGSAGGSATAYCAGPYAVLDSWSPRPGYRVEQPERGPDDEVEVTFTGDGGRFEIEVSCRNGMPFAIEDGD